MELANVTLMNVDHSLFVYKYFSLSRAQVILLTLCYLAGRHEVSFNMSAGFDDGGLSGAFDSSICS